MLTVLKRTLNKPLTHSPSGFKLEREGRERIRRISHAVSGVAWKSTLLNMLWIGGPVTLIGAMGGYYIGYGHLPTLGNMVFFVFFAVFTSVAGVIGNIVNNYKTAGKTRNIERHMLRVIDDLPDLIMMVRDLGVDQLEGDARRREGATILLRKQDLSPNGIDLAVRDLLEDAEAARIFADIETHRRIGLHSRIDDLVIDHGDFIYPLITSLRQAAPEAATLLEERFHGRMRDLNQGVARDENFIERVLSASEQHDDLLMTLDDAGHMFTLAFELINGREIPMLVFGYIGRWRYAEAFDRVEEARARYRISQAVGLSRLKALTVYLAEASETLVEDAAAGLQAEILLARSREAMDDLAHRIMQMARVENSDDALLHEYADTLANAVRLYRRMRDSFDQVGRHHDALLRAIKRWERIATSGPDNMTELAIGDHGEGLRIHEKRIALDHHAKAQLCSTLAPYLRQLHRKQRSSESHPHSLTLDVDNAKRLAIEIAVALEPHVHLSRPEVQRAIHSTNAADFSALEPGYSAATKAALAAAMVKELEDDLSRSAESLALALVSHYKVELPEDAMIFLGRQYGARRNVLNQLSAQQLPRHQRPEVNNERMPPLGRTPRHWYRALVLARRVLEA
ncbi:hypothetical protein [Carnimonas nigrificans]|uniref:hypothetical protein n=1 Tax=Carnimonas nigrificans TaxID=64323 RepID=UPI00046F9D97|nr:hypothetical protein [Carnimonas nigrificans]